MTVVSEDDDRKGPTQDEDEIPHRGLLSSMPKRTFYRVVLLLAMLAGIIYLRQRTAWIAGCMSNAFILPPPVEPRGKPDIIKAHVVLPADPAPSEKSH